MAVMLSPTIAVIASYVTEFVFCVPNMLQLGESIQASFSTGHGGKGFNMAVASHLAGAKVNVIMKVGLDVFGEAAIRRLTDLGLPTDGVYQTSDAPSGAGVVLLIPSGANAIALDPGANHALNFAEIDASHNTIQMSNILLASMEVLPNVIQHAFSIARARDVTTILNPAPVPNRPLEPTLLTVTDILTPNESEAQALTGIPLTSDSSVTEAAAQLLNLGVKAVVMTLGARGAYYTTGKTSGFVPAPQVKAVDTSGAGDAFNGGLAVALAEGQDLPAAVSFAIALSTLKVTRRGTSSAMPTRHEIESFRRQKAI